MGRASSPPPSTQGWAGVECLSGIPGLVGATPIQNVGAYGQDVSETVTWVEALDLDHRPRRASREREECAFAYRDSRFKAADKGRFIVLRVAYGLRPGGPPAVRYAELARHLEEQGLGRAVAGRGARDGGGAAAAEVDGARCRRTPNARSVGSFFTNPIVHRERAPTTSRPPCGGRACSGRRAPAALPGRATGT